MSVSFLSLAIIARATDVSAVGQHTVLTGQIVYFNDTALGATLSRGQKAPTHQRHTDVDLRIFIDFVDASSYIPAVAGGLVTDAVFTANTAHFAGDPTDPHPPNGKALRFGQGEGVGLVRDPENPTGCQEYTQTFATDEAILVRRGECTFLEKLMRAHEVGASGVVVINLESDVGINPYASVEDLKDVGDSLDDAAIVVLHETDGRHVLAMLDVAESGHAGRVVLALESTQWDTGSMEQGPAREDIDFTEKPVLYVNGYALLNTRLLI